MRLPSLIHRNQPDPAAAETEEISAARRQTAPVRDRRDDPAAYRSRQGAPPEAAPPAAGKAAGPLTRPLPVTTPRPRASGLATAGLVLAVVAALAVLSGVLAAPGIVLGVVALVFGLGGISATTRRHVAGRTEAVFAVLLGIAAVVVGVLAASGALGWLTTDTDQVARARDWLDQQLPWLDNI